MASRAGVGYSVSSNSGAAGVAAAEMALAEAGDPSPQIALMFHTAKHDPHQLHAGVRSVLGSTIRLLGGFTGGIITRDYLGYDGYECAVAVIASDLLEFHTFAEVGLKERGEQDVGLCLGKQIRARRDERGGRDQEDSGGGDGDRPSRAPTPGRDPNDGTGLIYMYDSIQSFTPESGFDLNIGTYVMEGLTEGLGMWPSAAGMGMIGNMQLSPTFQFFDDRVMQQAALALLVRGDSFQLDTTIMHGCRPSSSYHTITAAEKNVVLEIDGRPALDVIDDLMGPDSDRGWADYPLFVTLGVNKGDKFGPFREEQYANRLCMAVDRDRRGLVMFEPDLVEGSEVQLMRRAIDFDYIHQRAEGILEELRDRDPFFALYIDCMGRASAYCGSEGEEGAAVQQVIGSRLPLLGLYTGVELGAVMGRQQALDWTGVLCVFSERRTPVEPREP